MTWPGGGFYVDYTYDAANRMSQVRENGATSGVGVLATYGYDNLGRRGAITRGDGTSAGYGYDGISRLSSMTQNLAGADNDQSFSFSYTPNSQIASRSLTNTAYAYTASSLSQSYTRNGLNQYTSVAGVSFNYDARGNLTSDGARSFSYDLENRLTSVSGSASMSLDYDPLGRLRQTTSSSTTTTLLYDGDRLSAEYNSSGTLLRRYVHGSSGDEPLVWYEGSGTADRRHLIGDHQGSIIADSGSSTTRYAYGPYGEPSAWGGSRFRYTGQIALPEAQLYHYKARVYDPKLGRFLQTDPVGYEDDLNLYAYVRNDPTNATDPHGMICIFGLGNTCDEPAPPPPPPPSDEPVKPIETVTVPGQRTPVVGTTVAIPTTRAPSIPVPRPAPVISGLILVDMLFDVSGRNCTDSGCHPVEAPGSETIDTDANMYAKGGKQNKRDSGLAGIPDSEISKRARDGSLSSSERKRYITEEKARGIRHSGQKK